MCRVLFAARLWVRLAALLALAPASCTAISNTNLGAGIGESCNSDGDCHRAQCIFNDSLPDGVGGVCAIPCTGNGSCPVKTLCAAGSCRPEVKLGAVFVGNADDLDGWTLAHDNGLRAAASALGYLELNVKYGVLSGSASGVLDALLPASHIVLANGIDYESELRTAAAKYPQTQFLMIDNNIYSNGVANFTPYGVYLDEGYYLAGRIAAQQASKRLGFIAGPIFPQTVRLINAFTLGARSVKPNIVVEVRYIGFFLDLNTVPSQVYTDKNNTQINYFREQLLTRLLIDSGCEVIAHYANTQRSVRLVNELEAAGALPIPKPYTMAFGTKDSCKDGVGQSISTCFGSIFSDWTRLYEDTIERIVRHVFDPLAPVRADIDDSTASPVGFWPNPGGRNVDVTAILFENQALARATNPGPRERVFAGPFATNGQRDSDFDGIPDPPQRQLVAAGESLSDAENARGCFFVDGVVEKMNPDDPNSADRKALVPGGLQPQATVPNTSEPLLSTPMNRYNMLSVPPGVSTECRKNAPSLGTP